MEKYEKIRIVGRGAYGTVFLCLRLNDKNQVIIKQIPVEQMTKDERQSALNEVKVLSMLDHPNIIQYYENFLEDKALMIVMEYAQGGTLFEYLQQRNGNLLEEEEILKFFAQMLLSLQHVHSKQILHRDLKTQNILLDKKREMVKVGDFGISKVLSSKSKAVTVVGTPCYISPELCEGKPYNQKSDIWALGCVLYELASLKKAFEAANLPALILKIMRGTFAPISDHYSEDLRLLILSMLHLDPNKRPHINQILAQPILIGALLHLFTDMGMVPCTRVSHTLSSMPGSARGRFSLRGETASSRGCCLPFNCPLNYVDEMNFTCEIISLHILVDLSIKPQALSSVYCWGGGISSPLKIPLPSNDIQIVEVSTGRTQKAAVTKNGRLIVWESPGMSTDTLIPGATEGYTPAFIPRYIEGQAAVTIQHVACGDLFTACLTDRGILMTFGSGANGCLGHGNFNDVNQAKIVEALLGYEVIQVSCGASHVLAVTNGHEVFSWGRGDNGRLGLDNQESCSSPQPVPIPPDVSPCSVHCGVDCSMILTLSNQLLCCGSNRYNKLALDEISEDGQTRKQIEEIHRFMMVTSTPLSSLQINGIAIGTSHAAVATVDGTCYTCGSNQFGQLGYETPANSRQPQRCESLQEFTVTALAAGDTFTVVATSDGQTFTWGKGARGRLGRANENTNFPNIVQFPGEELFSVVSISCSHGNTLLATRPVPRGGSPLT